MLEKNKIRLTNGEIIEVRYITDYVLPDGVEVSVAFKGYYGDDDYESYRVVDFDAEGAIWEKDEKPRKLKVQNKYRYHPYRDHINYAPPYEIEQENPREWIFIKKRCESVLADCVYNVVCHGDDDFAYTLTLARVGNDFYVFENGSIAGNTVMIWKKLEFDPGVRKELNKAIEEWDKKWQ